MTKAEILEKLRALSVDFKRSATERYYASDECEASYYDGKEAAYDSAAYELESLIREIEAK